MIILVQVYAEDHGSPQRSATTIVYVIVQGSQRPEFNSYNYIFSVRDSQSLTLLCSHFAFPSTSIIYDDYRLNGS